VLNGLWKFQPGVAGAKEPAATGWGYIRVPGSWRTGYSTIAIPQVAGAGQRPMWEPWKNDSLDQGWYERTLHIPAGWNNRAIMLNFARISTDAWVYIDGKEAGRVAWPAGKVDLTPFVTRRDASISCAFSWQRFLQRNKSESSWGRERARFRSPKPNPRAKG
jgi:beta-galactosidase